MSMAEQYGASALLVCHICRLALVVVSTGSSLVQLASAHNAAALTMPALPAPSRPSAAEEDPSISAALTVGPCAPIDALYNELDLSWEVRPHACAWCNCAWWRLLGAEGACLLQHASAGRRGLSPFSRSLLAWWQEFANELDMPSCTSLPSPCS